VPKEPVYDVESSIRTPRRKVENPAWFEAQDLTVLKAWNNDIVEVQHEISLFGSLKVVDVRIQIFSVFCFNYVTTLQLHQNKLVSLPETFADLISLTNLDLSHNELTSLPLYIFTLPELVSLNLSHNHLTSLPFEKPFTDAARRQSDHSSFFMPAVKRATSPLPRLHTLDVSHNKLSANAIDLRLPASMTKVNLASNPLGSSSNALFKALAALASLKELVMNHADVSDDLFSSGAVGPNAFPKLAALDLGETAVTPNGAQGAFKAFRREVTFDLTNEDPPPGVLRVVVGKKIVKEAWEIEIERKARSRTISRLGSVPATGKGGAATVPVPKVLEPWEEETVLTEGAKRRMRAEAANAQAQVKKSGFPPASKPAAKASQREVMKEDWEIAAEQGSYYPL
jgi:hypothetical protein